MMKLKTNNYFRTSFLLPILFSLIGMGMLLLTEYFEVIKPTFFIGQLSIFLAYSIIIGGIPYLIITITFLWWMRGKRERLVKKRILLLPLFHSLLMLIGSIILNARLHEAFLFSGYSLFFGYFYIGIAFLGYFLLKHNNMIQEESIS